MSFGDVYAAEVMAAMFVNGVTYYANWHSANPIAGDQSTGQLTYPEYARVPRVCGTDFSVSGRTATFTSGAQAPMRLTGATAENQMYFSIGTASSGAGKILICVAIPGSPLTLVGDVPEIAAGSTFTLN